MLRSSVREKLVRNRGRSCDLRDEGKGQERCSRRVGKQKWESGKPLFCSLSSVIYSSIPKFYARNSTCLRF